MQQQSLRADRNGEPGEHRQDEKQYVGRRRFADDAPNLMAERGHQDKAWCHANDRAEHVVEEPNPARASDEIDQRERRNRNETDRSDREHPALRDAAAHATEPGSQHSLHRIAPNGGADTVGDHGTRDGAGTSQGKAKPRPKAAAVAAISSITGNTTRPPR